MSMVLPSQTYEYQNLINSICDNFVKRRKAVISELKDTCDLMTSSDYKERFIAEYEQLRIRSEKLGNTIKALQEGSLAFTPACPVDILEDQLEAMKGYQSVLEERAVIEGISLNSSR